VTISGSIAPAKAFRVEGGPTLGLKRAAGSFHRWHDATAQEAHEKRHGFQAAPAASLAGHVGRHVMDSKRKR